MKKGLRHLLWPFRRSRRHSLLTPHSFFLLSTCIALIYVVVLTSIHIPGLKNILGYASDITVAEVLNKTNEQRAQSGVQTLSLNGQLSHAALAKAQDMLARQYWAHNTPDGQEPWGFIEAAGYRYRVAGENLARNFSHTPDMVQAWLNSPTHRANLLSGQYSETGIAVLQGEMDGIPTTLVVQMFASPQQAIAAIPETAEATVAPEQRPSQVPVTETPSLPGAGDSEAPAPVARQPISPEQEALLGTESQLQAALVNTNNELEPRAQPMLSPLWLYRGSVIALVSILAVLLASDHRFAQHHRRSVRTGKHLAHILLLLALLITLGFTKTGSLF